MKSSWWIMEHRKSSHNSQKILRKLHHNSTAQTDIVLALPARQGGWPSPYSQTVFSTFQLESINTRGFLVRERTTQLLLPCWLSKKWRDFPNHVSKPTVPCCSNNPIRKRNTKWRFTLTNQQTKLSSYHELASVLKITPEKAITKRIPALPVWVHCSAGVP